MSTLSAAITAAQSQMKSAYTQYETDAGNLPGQIANIMALNNPGLEMMLLMLAMGNDTMIVQQDQISEDAAQLQIMTSLGAVVTDMTNQVNEIQNGGGSAAQLLTDCTTLQTVLGTTTLSGTTVQWIQPSMATKALATLNSFMSALSTPPATTPTATSIQNNINEWTTNPTKTYANGETGQQLMQKITGELGTLSTTFTSLSQTASNVVKEENTMLTQYQSNEGTCLSDITSLEKCLVGNQRGG